MNAATGQQDMFRSRLNQIIAMDHPLVKLAEKIDWSFFEQRFGAVYEDGPGRPPLPTRLMAGLAIVKHSYDLSDEVLCERWVENPYFQSGGSETTTSESHRSILERIEEKLNPVLGDEDERRFALEAMTWDPWDDEPRLFGGPHVSAVGWDPSIAGPRFDRVDVGSVGAHGVDPVSSFAGAYYDSGRFLGWPSRAYRIFGRTGRYGARSDPYYAEWRNRQIEQLDREYDDYCREQQSTFDHEFENWRKKRHRHRQSNRS